GSISNSGISGYDLFTGGIQNKDLNVATREVGRRRKYGSEDRVGHLMSKLQEQYKRNNSVSVIECTPTVTQLKSQKIQHIVFIDDISGSGRRIAEFWKYCVPRSVKSLLSFKRIELWIVLYAITSKGRVKLGRAIPNFPIKTHLISVLPESDYRYLLDQELTCLAKDYAKMIDADIANGRTPAENREQAFGAYAFVDLNTDESGNNGTWSKAQTYLALGNTMHAVARLGIDSTPMEGVDSELIGELFADELGGYVCEVALVIGYHETQTDYNAKLPKSRLSQEQVIEVI
ncbi:hypothetical protein LCGC14_2836120, partial [marine sediment metagenome]